MVNLPPSDYDSPWKEAIEIYFEDFMEFFFPQAHNDIDWARGYENGDIELQEILRDAEIGRRYADKLMKVWLDNGQETWILIHIEVQSQPDADFAERMYVYNHRFFDRYRREVISLAILGDNSPSWRPNSYGYSRWGFESRLQFPTVKLLDYRQNWEALENNHNPFAVVVMAHLMAMSSSNSSSDRYDSKLNMVRLLFQRGYNEEEIYELMRFVNWMMTLPPELEQDYLVEKQQIEEEHRMPYVTTWERRGIFRGVVEAYRDELRELLETRFGEVSAESIQRIYAISNVPLLKGLFKMAITIESLSEFEEILASPQDFEIPLGEPVRYFPVRPEWLDNPEIVRDWWGGDTPPPVPEERREQTRKAISEIGVRVNQMLDAMENARTSVIRVLEARFGEVSFEMTNRIYEFSDLEVLQDLTVAAATVESLAAFEEVLSTTREERF